MQDWIAQGEAVVLDNQKARGFGPPGLQPPLSSN